MAKPAAAGVQPPDEQPDRFAPRPVTHRAAVKIQATAPGRQQSAAVSRLTFGTSGVGGASGARGGT